MSEAANANFSIEDFKAETDSVGQHVTLPEVEILEALAALRHSEDPLANLTNRHRLSVNTAQVVATGQRLADYLCRFGLFHYDNGDTPIPRDDAKEIKMNPMNRFARRRYESEATKEIRRATPNIVAGLLATLPMANVVVTGISAIVHSDDPFTKTHQHAELSKLAARVAWSAELLVDFLEGTDLLDRPAFDAALQSMRP